MSVAVVNSATLKFIEDAFNAFPKNESQKKAFEDFCKVGLPGNKSEEYRFTPVGKFLEANFDLSLFGSAVPSEFKPETNGDDIVLDLINGKAVFNSNIFPSGIKIESRQVIANNNESDPFALLNYAFCDEEVSITIDANSYIEKPIHIRHFLDAESDQVMQNVRMVIEIGANASCKIIETFKSQGVNPVFSNVSAEYSINENAHLTYYRIQDDPAAFQVYNSRVRQVGKNVINSFVFSFSGNVVRNNSSFSIEAEGCESNFYGLYLPSEKSLIDNHTVADHKVPNCLSNELYKGIIDDNAKGVFNGKIYVRPNAQKTNAFQSNRNILLTDTATINTKPQLEIWADDVKCSHGCTTGQLDKEAMFYLMSRGISEESAQTMLLTAFASEVLGKIEDEKFRSEIESVVMEKLHSPY